MSHHFGDALVSDAHSDFGFLRLSLSVRHTDDVCAVGGLNIAHSPRDGHVDFVHVGAVRSNYRLINRLTDRSDRLNNILYYTLYCDIKYILPCLYRVK